MTAPPTGSVPVRLKSNGVFRQSENENVSAGDGQADKP